MNNNVSASTGQAALPDTLSFFRWIFGDDAPGWLSIWTLPDKATGWYPTDRLSLAVKYALSRATTDDVYFGLGLRQARQADGRGDSDDVLGIPGFWIEIDFKHDVHRKVNLPPTIDEALSLVREALPLEPSLMIGSGYGIHAYWLFRELWVFADDADRQAAYHLLHRLQATIQAVAKLHGWDVDSTFDLARVLRVPGTYNRKIPDDPQLVTIIDAHENRRYNASDFTEHLINIDETPYPQTTPETRDSDLPSIELETLKLNPWLIYLIQHGKDRDYPEKFSSRSEAHGKATEDLIDAGVDDQTIMSLLLDPRHDISKRPREKGPAWLAKDIARIRAKHNWNRSTHSPNGHTSPRQQTTAAPIILHADEITEQPMQWLWQPYLPRHMLVMTDGDPRLGKSMMLLQVAANLSRGLPFLDQLGKPTLKADVDGPQPTLILSAEDSLEHIMVPRLRKAGADLKYIKFLEGWRNAAGKEQTFTLQHMSILVQAIEAVHPVLVVLDPLVAYLGDIDMHRSNQTRPLMAALKTVAEQHHCTIMGVRHPSKLDQGGPLMYRGQGNMDIVGTSRSALWMQKHPTHQADQTLMIHSKTNVGMPGRTVIFSRARGEFEWIGVTRLAEWMLSGRGPDPYAFLEAFFWLEETMTPGFPYPSAEIEEKAKAKDFSPRTVAKARKFIGAEPQKLGSRWVCTLPSLE